MHADLGTTRRALVAKAGALALLGTPALATTHQDVELLHLGKQFTVAWAEEMQANAMPGLPDQDLNVYVERTAAIVHKIEKIPATTIDGLVVKARACSWTHDGEPFDNAFFDDPAPTDLRLASSILHDLMTIGGKPMRSA